MRKFNKIFLLVLLLGTTLLLAACGNKDLKNKTKEFAIQNQTSGELVVNFDEAINHKTVNDVQAYFVLYNGFLDKIEAFTETEEVYYYFYDAPATKVNYKDVTVTGGPNNVSDAFYRTFSFTVNGQVITYKQYNNNLSSEAKDSLNGKVLGYTVDQIQFDKKNKPLSGVILSESYDFSVETIKYHQVVLSPDGIPVIEEIKNVVSTSYYTEIDELIDKKKYINYTKKSVTNTLTFNGDTSLLELINDTNNSNNATTHVYNEDSQNLWLALTQVPLNTKTASFWNWLFLQMPIAYFMSWMGLLTGGSFALAILFTTIAVRTLAWPIYAKTNDMSMKMAVAQPEIDRMNRKYATRKDPESQQKQQMEMMAIYKKHKISMWGCLLPFLQMPIFFAMFEVVKRITMPGGKWAESVHNTNFLWTSLTSDGMVSKIIFTALVGITMFALQKISQVKPSYAKQSAKPAPTKPGQPNTENTMKIVSYVMIFMMIITAFATPGLALSYYWIIGNIYSIIQTLINRKISEKKHAKLEEDKLYGNSREIIDAEFKKKGEK